MFGLTGTERVGGADGCLSVEKNKKKNSFRTSKKSVFLGKESIFLPDPNRRTEG